MITEYHILLYIAGISLIAVFAYAVFLNINANKVFSRFPKVPASVCDKHGTYDAKHTMKLNVGELEVEQCPFCYEEAMNKSKVILEGKKT